MEIPNSKQQQLTFDKGITNVPSDAICSDNTLEECVGMTYNNGEYGVVQSPATHMVFPDNGSSYRLLFVHRTNSSTNYIALKVTNPVTNPVTNLVWGINEKIDEVPTFTENDTPLLQDVTGTPTIQAIGNIVIAHVNDTVYYMRWVGDGYNNKHISELPIPKIRFALMPTAHSVSTENDGGLSIATNFHKYIPLAYETYNNHNCFDEILSVVNLTTNSIPARDAIYGAYIINKSKLHDQKCFINPFAVRFALELYDGSLIYQSDPILMFPCYTQNSVVEVRPRMANTLVMYTRGFELGAILEEQYPQGWSELVKGIKVYVSREVDIYNLTDTWIQPQLRMCGYHYLGYGQFEDRLITDDISNKYNKQFLESSRHVNNFGMVVYDDEGNPFVGEEAVSFLRWHTFVSKPTADVVKEVVENGVFYELCTIELSNTAFHQQLHKLSDLFESTRLDNIEGYPRMANDDFYSFAKTRSDYMTVYNNRLILAGLYRTAFEGFSHFTGHYFTDTTSQMREYYIVTTLLINGVEQQVVRHFNSTEMFLAYFYYPDTRARKMTVYSAEPTQDPQEIDQFQGLEFPLKQHPALNGAYYLDTDHITDETFVTDKTLLRRDLEAISTFTEYLPSELSVSEVNNPYVFNASGYSRIPLGKIRGISNYTTALSQGQFGQYPLIIFGSEGIFAASIGSDGTFAAIHPMSREVLLQGGPIVQTDGAVFFVSEKGLMVAVGGDVVCMSEQLQGISAQPFVEFLKQAQIAYDYRDSILWIMQPRNSTAWLYNIKEKIFTHFTLPADSPATVNVINFYPDNLIQLDRTVYSLIDRVNKNLDNNPYAASFITRPMKLENAFALKTLAQVMHVAQMQGTLSLRIFASNNLQHDDNTWVELHSLLGTPWKYYKFQYTFTNLHATDTFAGTVVVTQERRTGKLR